MGNKGAPTSLCNVGATHLVAQSNYTMNPQIQKEMKDNKEYLVRKIDEYAKQFLPKDERERKKRKVPA